MLHRLMQIEYVLQQIADVPNRRQFSDRCVRITHKSAGIIKVHNSIRHLLNGVRFFRRSLTVSGLSLIMLVFAGCGGGSGGSQDDLSASDTDADPVALFDPVALSGTAIVPFPVDLFFSGTTDTTLGIPNSSGAPFVDQANLQDGFSTVASAFMDILGVLIDISTANSGLAPADRGIVVFDTTSATLLHPGIDYQVIESPVITTRTRLLIQWLRPLNPRSTYAVFATRNLRTTSGNNVIAGIQFEAVRSEFPIGSEDNPTPQTTPPLSDADVAQLEAIRQALQPLFQLGEGFLGLEREELVLAWPFTTQSIGDTLAVVESTLAGPRPAQIIGARDTGGMSLDTEEACLGAGNPAPVCASFGNADIYIGYIELPYYLARAANPQDPAPNSGFWLSDGTPSGGNSSLPGSPPCAFFAPSVSTTACFPTPTQRSLERVPVLVTIPNAGPPTGPWPVVITQHGITRQRSDALAIADAFAQAGHAMIAIDLPLHGITDPTNPFFACTDGSCAYSGLYAATGAGAGPNPFTERTFNLDLTNNGTGAPGPDGNIDGSGGLFINLGAPIVSRDNIRQAVSDLMNVTDTFLAAPSFVTQDGNGAVVNIQLNGTVRYLGHSLGGIVGGTLLGADNGAISQAVLAMPGGGIAKLLDGSGAFGPIVANGLAAAAGIQEGTDTYETFLRFAQTLIDAGDPINYAAQANADHNILMFEVVGEAGISAPDAVVPNSVPTNPPTVFIGGPLSGTDPLFGTMGLNVVSGVNPETPTPTCSATGDTVVQFTRGDHGSIFDPTASFPTTLEMQREAATFFASGGAVVPINGGGPLCP